MHKSYLVTVKTLILFLTAGLLITGCGFKLRKAPPLPESLKVMALQSTDPYGPLTLQLRRMLPPMGIQLVDAKSKPPVTLVIDSNTFSSIATTQSASSSTQQYTMTYDVVYHLNNAQSQTIYGPKTVHLLQTYSINQNQVLSTDQVQGNVQQQMQQDAVLQIVMQLASPDAEKAVAANEAKTAGK